MDRCLSARRRADRRRVPPNQLAPGTIGNDCLAKANGSRTDREQQEERAFLSQTGLCPTYPG